MLNQCRLLSRLSILGVKIVNRWIIESSSVSSDGLLNHRMKKKKQLDFLFKVFYYIAKWAHREKWGRSDKRKFLEFSHGITKFFFRRNFHAYDSQWMRLIFIIKHPLSLLLVAHSTLSRQALWGGRLLWKANFRFHPTRRLVLRHHFEFVVEPHTVCLPMGSYIVSIMARELSWRRLKCGTIK